MSIILESMRTLLNVRQKEHESLLDYTKLFKTTHDIMKSYIRGPIILKKCVQNMKGYDKATTDEIPKFQEHAFNQFLAYTYSDNADKTKYDTLLTGLQTQTSSKNDQYPKTITEPSNLFVVTIILIVPVKHNIINTKKIIEEKTKIKKLWKCPSQC
jgi:hypothetical protein